MFKQKNASHHLTDKQTYNTFNKLTRKEPKNKLRTLMKYQIWVFFTWFHSLWHVPPAPRQICLPSSSRLWVWTPHCSQRMPCSPNSGAYLEKQRTDNQHSSHKHTAFWLKHSPKTFLPMCLCASSERINWPLHESSLGPTSVKFQNCIQHILLLLI